MQGATRNPLGDPSLLGLTGGASLAMAVGLALGMPATAPLALTTAALGTLGAAVLVYACAAAATRLSGTPGAPSPIALVLAGAAVTAGTTAITTALLVISPTARDRLRFWSIGTVARAELSEALTLAPVILAGVLLAVAVSSGLDALALGDDLAHGLGSSPARVRGALLVAVVVLTSAAVALAGPVAFVGLLIPHALRRFRPPTMRLMVIGCALWGGVLVIGADLLGRTVAAPAEVHLGVTTVLLGVPVLLLLLRRTGVGA
jgi:iron complex transport system permease protein